ncbi:MAG: hypothetical protein HOV81_24490 [Kofleriaceae bacterium]|nr:hypothetical protein [Kofleriaceae bacterium]
MSHPYREAPPSTAVAVLPRPRRALVPWPWVAAIASGMTLVGAGAAAGFAALISVTVGLYGSIVTGWLRRHRATKLLAALPFPITHDRPSAAEPHMRAAPIRRVVIALRASLAAPDAERVAARAAALLDDSSLLSLHISGPRITLAAWPWGTDDLLLLAQVLHTWGTEVHSAHPIAEARVEWASSGPPLSS